MRDINYPPPPPPHPRLFPTNQSGYPLCLCIPAESQLSWILNSKRCLELWSRPLRDLYVWEEAIPVLGEEEGELFFLSPVQTPVTLCSGEWWSILVVRLAHSADMRSRLHHVSSVPSVAYSTGRSEFEVNLLRATTHLVVLGIKEMACVTHKFTRGLSKRQECPLWSAFTQEGAGKQQQQQQQQQQ